MARQGLHKVISLSPAHSGLTFTCNYATLAGAAATLQVLPDQPCELLLPLRRVWTMWAVLRPPEGAAMAGSGGRVRQ